MVTIHSSKAPAPIGPYSQAVKVGDWLYSSGQIGLDPVSGKIVEGGVEAETRQVMENLKAVLQEAGLDFTNVVKSTLYLKNMADFSMVNELYSSYFKEPFPARATVEVAGLPKGALVEIEMIAVVK